MGRWTRAELEEAFAAYRHVALDCGESGDWNAWTDLFAPDATYVEHHYGTMGGREAIRTWINKTMAEYPGKLMPHFPVEWYVIDEDRGWVVCQIWNRMNDPGDGSVHQAYNFTLLKYAGDGLWSYEEDIYNPATFATMIGEWEQRRRNLTSAEGG